MPAFYPTSSNVLGRITGKRQVKEILNEDARTLGAPLEITTQTEKSRPTNGHRRDSSVLSRSSATEIGQNVRRSISLRSHRSQPSDPSATLSGRARTSSASRAFNPTFTTSPTENEESNASPRPVQTSPPQASQNRSRIPESALNLSAKLTAQKLETYTNPDYSHPKLHIDSSQQFQTTEAAPNMTTLLQAPPSSARRANFDRPPVPSSYSVASSDSVPSTIVPPSTNNATQNERIYMQSTATPVPYHASTHDPKAVYKTIHEISAKRMATIEYLRKVHEGNVFFFSTVHYSPANLQSIPSMHPLKLGRRATNYFVLGYSLPALLDLNSGSPLEYLRSLASLLQEFEQYQNLMGMDSSGNSLGKGRMQTMFKMANRQHKPRRSSAAQDAITPLGHDLLGLPKSAGSDAASPMETSPSPISPGGHEFQYLVTPHLPFDPDFTQIYSTLCDTLVDTYAKLIDLVSSPDTCSPAVGDWFTKVDKTLRKVLMSGVVQEFAENTKSTAKSEVAGLGKLVLGGLM